MAGTSRDIVVVGAGIVGCLTGYLLAKQGAKVTILERDSVASHASGFAFGEMGALEGAGIPDPLLEFSLWCNRRHQTLAEELKEVSGNDSQFRICNRLTLAFDQPAVDQAKQSLQWQAKVADFSSQWLDTAQVLEVEPRVNPECLGGVLVQGAGSVEPYRYTLAAAQAGEKLGVEMALRRVTGLLTQGDRCCGVSFEGGQRAADAVVLAMGPWTEEASSWCQAPIPLVPLKGQILRLQLAGEPLRTSLHWGGSYAASKPRWTGLGGHYRRAGWVRRGYNHLGQRQDNGGPAPDGAVLGQRGAASSDRLPAALVARRPAHRREGARLAKSLLRHRSGP